MGLNMDIFENYKTPGFDELFMRMVYLTATKSKDPSSKIGAVIVKDNRVISTGYNGFPIGVLDSEERYNNRETKYKFVVHAEHNSILTAARFGISTLGATLYTNGLPCNNCMKSIIQSGINEIVIHSLWPEMKHSDWEDLSKVSKTMMEESGLKLRIFDGKLNLNGFLNGKVFDI
jgi:dCMP deaminase